MYILFEHCGAYVFVLSVIFISCGMTIRSIILDRVRSEMESSPSWQFFESTLENNIQISTLGCSQMIYVTLPVFHRIGIPQDLFLVR